MLNTVKTRTVQNYRSCQVRQDWQKAMKPIQLVTVNRPPATLRQGSMGTYVFFFLTLASGSSYGLR